MSRMGFQFEVVQPQVDESAILFKFNRLPWWRFFFLQKTLFHIIREKYNSLGHTHDADTVFCFDTVILFKNKILGKPQSSESAAQTLKKLSHRWHVVVTACLAVHIKNGRQQFIYDLVKTKVKFRYLTNKEISTYIASENILDAAGSYKIQGNGIRLVEKMEGCYFNVMGLPISFLNLKRNRL